MNQINLNATDSPQFRIVLLFWGESDFIDTETGELKSSQKGYRMSPKWGKTLVDIFPYFTKVLAGQTQENWKNRIPRKLMIYEGETEIFRLPQGTGAITDRKGNVQQRLKSLKEWRECIELYERTNGRQFRTSFNQEPKNVQKSVQVYNSKPHVAFQSNIDVEEREKDQERVQKIKVWEKIKTQFDKENLSVDADDEKHIKRELLLRNIQHLDSFFDDAMIYLRKAHERYQVAIREAEQIIKEKNIEAATVSKDRYQEFKSPIGFRSTPKVTTNSNPSLDNKKAQAVQELYDLYKNKNQKEPPSRRVSVWQHVFTKSNSETEINNHLTEIKQSI